MGVKFADFGRSKKNLRKDAVLQMIEAKALKKIH